MFYHYDLHWNMKLLLSGIYESDYSIFHRSNQIDICAQKVPDAKLPQISFTDDC